MAGTRTYSIPSHLYLHTQVSNSLHSRARYLVKLGSVVSSLFLEIAVPSGHAYQPRQLNAHPELTINYHQGYLYYLDLQTALLTLLILYTLLTHVCMRTRTRTRTHLNPSIELHAPTRHYYNYYNYHNYHYCYFTTTTTTTVPRSLSKFFSTFTSTFTLHLHPPPPQLSSSYLPIFLFSFSRFLFFSFSLLLFFNFPMHFL